MRAGLADAVEWAAVSAAVMRWPWRRWTASEADSVRLLAIREATRIKVETRWQEPPE